MKRKHTVLILIISTIATIVMVLLFVFFLKVIKNKNQHISAVLTTLEEKTKEKENVNKFSEKFTEIKSIQNSIISRFLDPDKIDTFVGYLEEIGSSVGSEIIVSNIEVLPKVKNTISIKLSATGNFQEVVSVINLLENIPYQITITQMYLNKEIKQTTPDEFIDGKVVKGKIPETSIWQADITFNILSLK